MLKRLIVSFLLATATLTAAQTVNALDVNINEDDLELSVSQLKNFSRNSRVYYSVGYLSAYDENSEQQGLFSAEMMMIGLTEIKGFSAGVGLKGFATRINRSNQDRDATGGAVQIRVAYTLPLIIKTTFSGQGGYAPKSLSFGDLEQYTELRLQVDAEVIDGGLFYLGYRMIDMEFENNGGSYEFNNAPYLGIKFVF